MLNHPPGTHDPPMGNATMPDHTLAESLHHLNNMLALVATFYASNHKLSVFSQEAKIINQALAFLDETQPTIT